MFASATITTATSVSAIPARMQTIICLTVPTSSFPHCQKQCCGGEIGYMLWNASLHISERSALLQCCCKSRTCQMQPVQAALQNDD